MGNLCTPSSTHAPVRYVAIALHHLPTRADSANLDLSNVNSEHVAQSDEQKPQPAEEAFTTDSEQQARVRGPAKRPRKPKEKENGCQKQASLTDLGLTGSARRGQSSEQAPEAPEGGAGMAKPSGTGNAGDYYEEDVDTERRKRRKTVSPTTESLGDPVSQELAGNGNHVENDRLPGTMSWHEQLVAQAMDADRDMVEAWQATRSLMPDVGTETSGNISSSPPAVYPPVPDSCSPPPPQTSSVAAPSPGRSTTGELGVGMNPGSSSSTAEAKRPTTPKKMLRLTKAGKFSSPISKSKNKEPAKYHRSSRRKQPKTLAAVMRYGGDDRAQRTSVGRRIFGILEGSERFEASKPKSEEKPAKLIGPPKPTHPFFLGKKDPNKAEENVKLGTQIKEQESPEIKPSPVKRESAVGPGKLRRNIGAEGRAANLPGVDGVTQKTPKQPGVAEPAWPVQGTNHVRGDIPELDEIYQNHANQDNDSLRELLNRPRKLKDTIRANPSDALLPRFAKSVRVDQLPSYVSPDEFESLPATLRLPQRVLLVDVEIQRMIRKEIKAHLPEPFELGKPLESDSEDELALTRAQCSPQPHPALLKLYSEITGYLSPFDRCTCETQSWVQKYAPQCATDILRIGKEVKVLRDWLQSLRVLSVESGSKEAREISSAAKNSSKKPAKKKQKISDDLDDFLVNNDDDDANELEELSDINEEPVSGIANHKKKRSLARQIGGPIIGGSIKTANAVLISGPHGCGKSAAVYAVAKELGFEVFEINPGSRRSGKDVLDKVGDMTENHLVQRSKPADSAVDTEASDTAESDLDHLAEAVRKDVESGRQGTMNTFFKPLTQRKPKKDSIRSISKATTTDGLKVSDEKPSKPKHQKQSLILLEEVDVLFEEDRQFWSAILNLMTHSKRPIIMTCNNENFVLGQVPEQYFHAMLRFDAPPRELVADYLLLIAAKEGHIISRDAVSSLYQSKEYDLRATITELDLWCQMGVGDRKGGLEWLYQRWPPGSDLNEQGRPLRVVSQGTYQKGMGWIGRDLLYEHDSKRISYSSDEELMHELWETWGIEPEDVCAGQFTRNDVEASQQSNFEVLNRLENLFQYCSAADVYCPIGLPARDKEPIDATIPLVSDKSRADYLEGYSSLLDTPPVSSYGHLSAELTISTTKLSMQIPGPAASQVGNGTRSIFGAHPESCLTNKILAHRGNVSSPSLTRASFGPLEDLAPVSADRTYPLIPSCIDLPLDVVATQIAPFIRGIVRYEREVAQRRIREGGLLCAGGASGCRTTRASRSAREGGRREGMRKERWWEVDLNRVAVLETSGKDWGVENTNRGNGGPMDTIIEGSSP
ncbi:hypothetical protein BDY21DRAFT_358552 [Lineolata rhizophorae]|uniref:AAA+ ATPase domain-containing protein n=1 Tax=Lineolata rhizophorae TaxID=578093 RepID=A0A6A6NMM8_9PEZI|nr:hypothetical protein BDY21DRAFT_358552 [Lineolata rhizophorae]